MEGAVPFDRASRKWNWITAGEQLHAIPVLRDAHFLGIGNTTRKRTEKVQFYWEIEDLGVAARKWTRNFFIRRFKK
jgi:hypothetical protein